MYIGNINVIVEPVGNKYKFTAISQDTTVAFGVVETFTFNLMTGVFSAGSMKLSGVKSVKM